jgi:predicted secreted Zn-dependent protease
MEEIVLEGLNDRQRVLADIMWSIEEWTDVERFIATLPKRERAECESIVEMMKMELVEQYRKGMEIENTQEANKVIKSVLDKFKK